MKIKIKNKVKPKIKSKLFQEAKKENPTWNQAQAQKMKCVYNEDNDLIGFYILLKSGSLVKDYPSKDVLSMYYVKPYYRGKGYGTMIVANVLKKYKDVLIESPNLITLKILRKLDFIYEIAPNVYWRSFLWVTSQSVRSSVVFVDDDNSIFLVNANMEEDLGLPDDTDSVVVNNGDALVQIKLIKSHKMYYGDGSILRVNDFEDVDRVFKEWENYLKSKSWYPLSQKYMKVSFMNHEVRLRNAPFLKGQMDLWNNILNNILKNNPEEGKVLLNEIFKNI